MEEFLEQLHDLLKEHNATIVRSADESNKLVLSMFINDQLFEEEFEEEIGTTSISNGWHKPINNKG